VIRNFLPDIARKRQGGDRYLIGVKQGREAPGGALKASTLFLLPKERP
jgi:hypothetical protein